MSGRDVVAAQLLPLVEGHAPDRVAPALSPELRLLIVVNGDGASMGDLGLTLAGRARCRSSGRQIGSVFDDAIALYPLMEVRGWCRVVKLAKDLRWGVQRVVAAGDVLVIRGVATWSCADPATCWRRAALVRAASTKGA